MTFMRFQEYLDKNKKIEKPIVDALADTGPDAAPKPPKAATKGKNWHLVGKSGAAAAIEAAQINDTPDGADPVAYSAPGTDPGLEVANGGKEKESLGDKGDAALIYNPKTVNQTLKTGWQKTTKEPIPPKMVKPAGGAQAESFAEAILRKTSGSEVKQILETSSIIAKNRNLIETLVRDIKKKGGFEDLVAYILTQPEAYTEIAKALQNENTSNKLRKALREMTAPPEIDNLEDTKKKVK